MAKSTKKQQQRALKKQKACADKRRQLRHADRAPADPGLVPRRVRPSAASTSEGTLRHSIQAFAFQPRFGADFRRAIALYFEVEDSETTTLALDEAEMAEFQEWFFMDFATGSGKRLIELFAEEEGPVLPSDQRQMLRDWMATNRLRLFEVQAVTPGVGETVADLLSGEVLHCNDISVSKAARRWSILLARPLLTEGHWHFTGAGKLFSPLEKDVLVSFAHKWTLGPGHPSFLTLGDLTVSGTTLELICTSRERLAAGRQLLEAVLEGAIIHRGDHFTAMDTTGVASSPSPAAQTPRAADSELRQVQNELLGREMKKWLDTSVPRLNQQTPREAAKTPAGRAALEELLKVMDYLEEGDPGRSDTPLSVRAVRRELGLEDPGVV